MNKESEEAEHKKNKDDMQFAGSETCANCHKNIYDTHVKTAHYLTTRPATEKYILGSFEKGKNIYTYNPNLFIAMQKRDSGLYQVVYFKGEEKKVLPFDMVIGSGTKGQSFAYWQNNRLFQLPITYYEFAHQWANSPGFPGKVQFDRPITSRCLECHSTYVKSISAPDAEKEEFDRNKIIFGVDCEKCHGPATRHVEYQTQNPNEKRAKYIVNLAKLSRQQNLDMCALCHGGNIKRTQPSFTFTAGDDLSKYFVTDSLSTAAVNFGTVDVHGNQYGLLQSSKCFRMSQMTCSSCHNTHENERRKTEVFNQRCITCHTNVHENFTTISQTTVSSIKENCIN
ncbi:MAG TPA: multiheme c-type cytochrome, partial [Chitinophagaceae bacterium]|nr:multiheme c-type cytochrome [Chitinophagaceae bacterium]